MNNNSLAPTRNNTTSFESKAPTWACKRCGVKVSSRLLKRAVMFAHAHLGLGYSATGWVINRFGLRHV